MSIRLKSILERFIIYFLIIVFSGVNVYLYFHKISIRKKVQEVNAKTDDINKKIASSSDRDQRLKQQQAAFEKIKKEREEEIEQYSNIIPTKKRLPELIDTVQQKADFCHIMLNTINYSKFESMANKNYSNFDFTVTLTGKYGNVKRFLWEIENIDWIVNVESLSILKLPDDMNDMSLVLNLRTFFISG